MIFDYTVKILYSHSKFNQRLFREYKNIIVEKYSIISWQRLVPKFSYYIIVSMAITGLFLKIKDFNVIPKFLSKLICRHCSLGNSIYSHIIYLLMIGRLGRTTCTF